MTNVGGGRRCGFEVGDFLRCGSEKCCGVGGCDEGKLGG